MSNFATFEEIQNDIIKRTLTEDNIKRVAEAIWKNEGSPNKNRPYAHSENMTIWDFYIFRAKMNIEFFAALDADLCYDWQYNEILNPEGKSYWDGKEENGI